MSPPPTPPPGTMGRGPPSYPHTPTLPVNNCQDEACKSCLQENFWDRTPPPPPAQKTPNQKIPNMFPPPSFLPRGG